VTVAALFAGVDRGEVRRVARDVFSASKYERPLSWWDRFLRWLAEHLHLSPRGASGPVSGAASLVLYLFLIAVAAAVVALIVLVLRRWTPRTRPERSRDVEVEVEEVRSVAEWRDDAERAEAAGRWKDAIRARFRELVGELVERGVLDPEPGRTTGEFRAEIGERLPVAGEAFDDAALVFELAWYADLPCDGSDLSRLRAASATVLGAAERQLATSGTAGS
jgi:hypothetical protein